MLRLRCMKHYLYLVVLLMCQLTWGQIFDPPPIIPNPFATDGSTYTPRPGRSSATFVDDDVAEEVTVTATAEPGNRFRAPLVEREKTRVAILQGVRRAVAPCAERGSCGLGASWLDGGLRPVGRAAADARRVGTGGGGGPAGRSAGAGLCALRGLLGDCSSLSVLGISWWPARQPSV